MSGVRCILARLAIGCLLAQLPVVAQPREVKPGWNIFTLDQDIQLGKEAAAEIEKKVQLIKNPELTQYFERIGKRLVATGLAGDFPYSFKVVLDPSINAFALPGGPTYMHTGLIAAADDEAQIAGVVAHEISHVALRHGTNQASRANLIQLPALLASMAIGGGKSGGLLAQLGQLGIGLTANSVLLKYSRNAERDADILGARIMHAAGYDPAEMARFFEKLEAQGSKTIEFFSSHPNPGNRIAEVQRELQYLPKRQYNTRVGDIQKMKAIVEELHRNYKKDQLVQGSVAQPSAVPAVGLPSIESVRPSASWAQFNGAHFSLRYPANWRASAEAAGNAVRVASPEGVVNSSTGVQILYGIIAEFRPGTPPRDLRTATQEVIAQTRRNNPSLTVVGVPRSYTLAGVRALITPLEQDSAAPGEKETVLLVTSSRPNGFFYILFVAPARHYAELQPAFENTLRSITFRE